MGVELLGPDNATPESAYARSILGISLIERILGDREENLEQALRHLEIAMSNLSDNDDRDRLQTLQGLIAVRLRRKSADPRADLVMVNALADQALLIAQRLGMLHFAAQLRVQRGVAHFRLLPDDSDAQEVAAEIFLSALEDFPPEFYPTDRRRVLRELGGVRFRQRSWALALAAHDEAVLLGDYLESFAYTTAGRFGEVAELHDVHVRRAYCLLKLGRPVDALITLEQGQARLLAQSLPEVNTAEVDPALRDALDAALAAAREAAWKSSAGDEDEAELRSSRQRVDDARLAIQAATADDDWRVEDELLELIPPSGAIVYPVITSQGSAIFVLTEGVEVSESVVWLDDVTDDAVRAIVDPTSDSPGWLVAYREWGSTESKLGALDRDALPSEVDRAREQAEAAWATWLTLLDRVTAQLWGLLMGPIHHRLTERGVGFGAKVACVPSKWLSVLPLAAAWTNEGNKRHYFIDDYVLSMTPSARALAISQDRLDNLSHPAPGLVAIVDSSLNHAAKEVTEVQKHFGTGTTVLVDEDARVDQIAGALPGRSHLHLACHGHFDWTDPISSALALPSGEALTIGAINASMDLSQIRLVTMSACETGISELDLLPTEFRRPSGGTAASRRPHHCRHSVECGGPIDVTADGTFFREHMRNGRDPAEALRLAQRELKLVPEYSHPFYWAAFVATCG